MDRNIPNWITNLALDIFKNIRQYEAMPRFQEMVNKWAEDHEAEIANEITWNKQRASHFEKNVATNDRLQNEQAGPPEDGWQFQNYVQHTGNSHNMIQGWVPPILSTSAEPEITHLLPLTRDHELTLHEKYTILSAVYDYGRKGTEGIPPWQWPSPDEWDKPGALSNAKRGIFFEILCDAVSDLGPDDEGWLRVILEDVKKDVAEWAGGQLLYAKEQANGAVTETRLGRYVRWAKNHWLISIIIFCGLLIIAVGTVVEKFDSIVAFYNKVTYQQETDQIQTERVEDKPIVNATATVEIIISSEEQLNVRAVNRGAVLAFGKDTEALLTLSSKESMAKQMGTSEVRYSSELDMKITDKAFKQPLSFLQQVEFAQVRFDIIPPNSEVLSGTVVCIFNNNITIELSVPSQKMCDKLIKIPDVNIAEILKKHSEIK